MSIKNILRRTVLEQAKSLRTCFGSYQNRSRCLSALLVALYTKQILRLTLTVLACY